MLLLPQTMAAEKSTFMNEICLCYVRAHQLKSSKYMALLLFMTDQVHFEYKFTFLYTISTFPGLDNRIPWRISNISQFFIILFICHSFHWPIPMNWNKGIWNTTCCWIIRLKKCLLILKKTRQLKEPSSISVRQSYRRCQTPFKHAKRKKVISFRAQEKKNDGKQCKTYANVRCNHMLGMYAVDAIAHIIARMSDTNSRIKCAEYVKSLGHD